MRLNASEKYRLYSVSETLNKKGRYCLEAFADTAYNEVINERDIDVTLWQLADALFGQSGCHCFEIPDDIQTAEDGRLCIDIDDTDCLEIRDIVGEINVDPEDSRLYVLVNASRTEYYWVAAVPAGTVYSG